MYLNFTLNETAHVQWRVGGKDSSPLLARANPNKPHVSGTESVRLPFVLSRLLQKYPPLRVFNPYRFLLSLLTMSCSLSHPHTLNVLQTAPTPAHGKGRRMSRSNAGQNSGFVGLIM